MGTEQSKYVPPPTLYHAAVPIGNKIYQWGGKGSEQRRNMVDVFDTSTEQWECRATRGPPPPGIEYCAYAVIGSSLFTFAGDDSHSRYNSLHQLDTETMEWRELVPWNPSDAPQKKSGCAMVSLDEDKLVVFAGQTEHKFTDELHIIDTKKMTWTPQPTTGTKPPPLAAFIFTKIDATRAVVFGGGDGKECRNDVYILDMREWYWTLLDVSGSPIPPARLGHAACCLVGPLTGQEDPLLVVVGGMSDGSKVLDDVWLLDIDGRRWKQVALIRPRYGHTAVFGDSPDCRQLVLWGGANELGDSCGETTLLNFDLDGGEWKVMSVVKEDQLGKPEERPREKMERLWPQPTETPPRATEVIASQAERRKEEAEAAKEREESLRRVEEQEKVTKALEERLRRAEELLKTPPQSVPAVPQKVEMKPEMFELKFKYKVVGTVQADWADLAYALHFQTATVKAIKKDTDDVNEACTDVLSRWLDGEGEREPRTWATLLEALTDMGKTELAKQIGQNLD